MTAMMNLAPDNQQIERSTDRLKLLSRYWVPALATLLVHSAAAALLLSEWQPSVAAVPSSAPMQTRLVSLTAPEPEPQPQTQPEPIAAPAQPVIEPQPDQAAIARKRVEQEQQEREALARQQKAQLQQEREREQERLERKQREQQLADQRRIEQAHRAAEHAAAQRALQTQQKAAQDARKAAASMDSSQYQPISKKAPAYPRRALNQKKEGDCVIEYTVTAQGRVANPSVVEGACDPVFARPSIASASSFRYQPRIVGGRAVAVPGVRNTFRFRIEQ
jgi:protein TonB